MIKHNSGNYNSGDHNSGHWNSGSRNSGDLNTTTPPFRIFNKETSVDRDEINYPDFFYFDLNEWIDKDNMSHDEMEAHPDYITTGGYLKKIEYKQAWRKSWENADEEDKRKVFDLPNWDNEIFKEISGIDVEKELSKKEDMIEIDGKKISKSTIKEALKEYLWNQ